MIHGELYGIVGQHIFRHKNMVFSPCSHSTWDQQTAAWNFGVVAVLWLEIFRYMLSGVEISVTTNHIIDVSWPRYFNTAVFLTHCWPGGRCLFRIHGGFFLHSARCSAKRQRKECITCWICCLAEHRLGGGTSLDDSVVTSLEKLWRSLELLCYNILYIYIVYKNAIYDLYNRIIMLSWYDMMLKIILWYIIIRYIERKRDVHWPQMLDAWLLHARPWDDFMTKRVPWGNVDVENQPYLHV